MPPNVVNKAADTPASIRRLDIISSWFRARLTLDALRGVAALDDGVLAFQRPCVLCPGAELAHHPPQSNADHGRDDRPRYEREYQEEEGGNREPDAERSYQQALQPGHP